MGETSVDWTKVRMAEVIRSDGTLDGDSCKVKPVVFVTGQQNQPWKKGKPKYS